MSPNYKKSFDEEGCIVIPNFFSEEELSRIYPIIKKAHEKWLKINQKEYLKYKMINSNVITSEDHFNAPGSLERIELFNFIASEKILKLVHSLISTDSFFLGSQVFFNPKDHDKKGYWHRDTQYTGVPEEEQKKAMLNEPVLHFHIPFIDDDNFELVPGTHKRWDSPTEYDVRMNSNHSPLENSVSYDCKRGEARVFSAYAFYRGKTYGPKKECFVFDPLFALRTKKSGSYINPKGMPEEIILDQITFKEPFLA